MSHTALSSTSSPYQHLALPPPVHNLTTPATTPADTRPLIVHHPTQGDFDVTWLRHLTQDAAELAMWIILLEKGEVNPYSEDCSTDRMKELVMKEIEAEFPLLKGVPFIMTNEFGTQFQCRDVRGWYWCLDGELTKACRVARDTSEFLKFCSGKGYPPPEDARDTWFYPMSWDPDQ